MKKSTLFLLATIILICSQGCDPASQYPISYKIDGTPWYAESAPCLLTGLNNISINATPTVQNQQLSIFYFTQYSVVLTSLMARIIFFNTELILLLAIMLRQVIPQL